MVQDPLHVLSSFVEAPCCYSLHGRLEQNTLFWRNIGLFEIICLKYCCVIVQLCSIPKNFKYHLCFIHHFSFSEGVPIILELNAVWTIKGWKVIEKKSTYFPVYPNLKIPNEKRWKSRRRWKEEEKEERELIKVKI